MNSKDYIDNDNDDSGDDLYNDRSVVVTRAMKKKRVQFNMLADCIKFSVKEAASAATVSTKVVITGDEIYPDDVELPADSKFC